MARPYYSPGNFLSARDLQTEHQYRQRRLQRHNRFLHGWGVVCGMRVVPGQDPTRPWALVVCPGYALDCCGNEIEVREPALLDIREFLWTRLGEANRIAYAAIRYAGEPARPVPEAAATCGCDDTRYTPSRIRDGFRLDVLWEMPDSEQGDVPDLCEQPIMPCPDCADHAHVVLAAVRLPASEGDPITASHIDNVRR
jgi:hypothetical protein